MLINDEFYYFFVNFDEIPSRIDKLEFKLGLFNV